MRDETLLRGLGLLFEAFDKDLTKTKLEAWQMSVGHLADEQFLQAVKRCLAECKFIPKPADLLERVQGHGAMGEGAEDLAIQAWDQLARATQRYGKYRSIDFEDKAINAAVRSLGGWTQLCEQQSDEFNKWTRLNFMRAYQAYQRGGISEESARYLPGVAEKENGFADEINKIAVTSPLQLASGANNLSRSIEPGAKSQAKNDAMGSDVHSEEDKRVRGIVSGILRTIEAGGTNVRASTTGSGVRNAATEDSEERDLGETKQGRHRQLGEVGDGCNE